MPLQHTKELAHTQQIAGNLLGTLAGIKDILARPYTETENFSLRYRLTLVAALAAASHVSISGRSKGSRSTTPVGHGEGSNVLRSHLTVDSFVWAPPKKYEINWSDL